MGIVYLLQCDDGINITHKIGYTRGSVQDRIKSLQVGNGYEILELSSFCTEYAPKLETTLHRYFKHHRLKGEWFKLEKADIDGFENTCLKIEKNFKALKENPFFK